MIRMQVKPCIFLKRFIKQNNEVRKTGSGITCESQKSLNIFDGGQCMGCPTQGWILSGNSTG